MDAFANNAALQYRLSGYDHSEKIRLDNCSDVLSCNLADLSLNSRGRIVEINARIKAVCPGKRTAVAVELYELDEEEAEHPRGMKVFSLPAHNESGNRDILIENIRFALPEDTNLSCEGVERKFAVHTTVHYIDSVYACSYDKEKR